MPDLRELLEKRIKGAIEPQKVIKQGETVSEYFSQYDSRAKMKEMMENRRSDEEMEFDDDDAKSVKHLAEEGLSQDTINKIAVRQLFKREIKEEQMIKMEQQAHLKYIETH